MRRASTGGWSSMNVPLLYLLTVAHLVAAARGPAAAAAAGQEAEEEQRRRRREEDEDDEEESRSGRRTCRLYCRVGIGFHLQIHPDGRVNGSHEADRLSVLELFAVSQGVIGIRGVYSDRFLAMNKKGRLHATTSFTDDCKFRERFQENSYNTYASALHWNRRTGRQWFVALNKRGKAKMGSGPRVKAQHVSTHFLPRLDDDDDDGYGRGERGFAVTDGKGDERKKTPPDPPLPKAKVQVGTRPKKVKYWPKYRFG
ncbi:fibroblast growth factor 5 [Hippocampus zosterae]|uniref:fibroblast growth factor 5 n=1 Tax=Hippocampus zosterae TaxID=109293 RepID=UPI00223CC4A2|nr:fibroblast growth factor 5 [Hippocampus zosterae]